MTATATPADPIWSSCGPRRDTRTTLASRSVLHALEPVEGRRGLRKMKREGRCEEDETVRTENDDGRGDGIGNGQPDLDAPCHQRGSGRRRPEPCDVRGRQ